MGDRSATPHPLGALLDSLGPLSCRKASEFLCAIADEIRTATKCKHDDPELPLNVMLYAESFPEMFSRHPTGIPFVNQEAAKKINQEGYDNYITAVDCLSNVDVLPLSQYASTPPQEHARPPRRTLFEHITRGDNNDFHIPGESLSPKDIFPAIYMDSGPEPSAKILSLCSDRNMRLCETYSYVNVSQPGAFIHPDTAREFVKNYRCGTATVESCQFWHNFSLDYINQTFGTTSINMFRVPWRSGHKFVNTINIEVGDVNVYQPTFSWSRSSPICDPECDPTPFFDVVIPAERTNTYSLGFRFPSARLQLCFDENVSQVVEDSQRRADIPHWYTPSAKPTAQFNNDEILCFKRKLDGFCIFISCTNAQDFFLHGRGTSRSLHSRLKLSDVVGSVQYGSLSMAFEIIEQDAYLIGVRVNGIRLNPHSDVLQAFVNKTFSSKKCFKTTSDLQVGTDILQADTYNVKVEPNLSPSHHYDATKDEGVVATTYGGKEFYIKSQGRRTVDIDRNSLSGLMLSISDHFPQYNVSVTNEVYKQVDDGKIHEVSVITQFVWIPIAGFQAEVKSFDDVDFVTNENGRVTIEGIGQDFESLFELISHIWEQSKTESTFYYTLHETPVTIQGYCEIHYVQPRPDKSAPDALAKMRHTITAPFPAENPRVYKFSTNHVYQKTKRAYPGSPNRHKRQSLQLREFIELDDA